MPVLAQSWESALPEAVLTLDPDDVPVLVHIADTGQRWRIEVTGGGGFWIWRTGRGAARISRYGGRFDQLSNERKAEYHVNKRKQARRRKAKAKAAVSSGR